MSTIFYLRDNNDLGNVFDPDDWDEKDGDLFLFGSQMVSDPEEDEDGSLAFTFDGTFIALVGQTQNSAQAISVTIDKNPPSRVNIVSDTYAPWYESPHLADGTHTLKVQGMGGGMGLDYVLISPSATTQLASDTIVVDDADSGISYSGSWQAASSAPLLSVPNFGSVAPLQHTTHETSGLGDHLTFSYTGTNLTMYGLLRTLTGKFTLSYQVDGGPVTSSSFPPPGVNSQVNIKLLETGALPAGKHTILVNVTECFDTSVIVDFLTYRPSFDTLPAVTTTTQAPDYGWSTPKVHHPPIGPIVGGVIAGWLVLSALTMALFCMCHRRKSQKKNRLNKEFVREALIGTNDAVGVIPAPIRSSKPALTLSCRPPEPPSPSAYSPRDAKRRGTSFSTPLSTPLSTPISPLSTSPLPSPVGNNWGEARQEGNRLHSSYSVRTVSSPPAYEEPSASRGYTV